mmetsp:Transcript_3512/g.12655  ORF Transcript_3512/g.12655 Transcript_3512/m.12655 type:complete len:210 (-) Transcript_3512:1224-1853(-)
MTWTKEFASFLCLSPGVRAAGRTQELYGTSHVAQLPQFVISVPLRWSMPLEGMLHRLQLFLEFLEPHGCACRCKDQLRCIFATRWLGDGPHTLVAAALNSSLQASRWASWAHESIRVLYYEAIVVPLQTLEAAQADVVGALSSLPYVAEDAEVVRILLVVEAKACVCEREELVVRPKLSLICHRDQLIGTILATFNLSKMAFYPTDVTP